MASVADISVVKIGGSLLTDKARECVFDEASALRLAGEFARAGGPLVLLHGTGSFGKPPARRHGYLDGFLAPGKASTVSEVEGLLDELRVRVMSVLRAQGLAACSLSASALMETDGGAICRCETRPIQLMIERGLTAVLSGALVADRSRGFAVCSSDAMAARVAAQLGARRLLFVTDTPGVMRRDGTQEVLLPELTESSPDVAARSEGDVSGGMSGKVRAGFEAARAGVPTFILDGRVPGRLLQALRGEEVPGTWLRPTGGAARKEGTGECAA
jgi:isopentenyl phosphate kinase